MNLTYINQDTDLILFHFALVHFEDNHFFFSFKSKIVATVCWTSLLVPVF